MKRILLFSILLCSSLFLSAQSLVVEVPRVVGQDEAFKITFTINGEPTNFSPPSIQGFDILAGPSPSTMRSTTIINGKQSQSITVSYTYVLQAKSVGKFVIPSASVVVGGKNYKSEPVTVEVVKGDSDKGVSNSQDGAGKDRRTTVSGSDLFIVTSVSKSKVVKGEPVIVTIKLYTREQIVGFEDVKFPSFNGFWSQEIDSPTSVNFVRENLNGQIYEASLLRRFVLIPQQSGSLTISPAEMLCSVQVPVSSSGARSIFDDFFGGGVQVLKKRVSSKPIALTVTPLPASAPLSFTGAVGKYEMSVKLNRDSISTNDAASLLVTISGTGNVRLIEAPKVDLPSGFELFDSKDDLSVTGATTGKKEFEYPFIARAPGEFKIPPIEFSYFDYDKMQYVTLTSKETIIRVTGTASSSSPTSSIPLIDRKSVVNLSEDIRYINQSTQIDDMGSRFFFASLFYIIICIVIILLYFVIDGLLAREIRMRKDTAGLRTRRANKIAGTRLKKANTLLDQQLYEPFYDELHRAIEGYISDKLLLNISDMSRSKISEQLSSRGIATDKICEIDSLLDSCEFAKYSPQKDRLSAMKEDYNKAISLISELEVRL